MEHVIQFLTDERLLIPGTGSVGVKGQILEIGPGKPGANFPYRSPDEQRMHYGEQFYVLIQAIGDDGEDMDHPDIGRTLEGVVSGIEPEDASAGPQGVHKVMKERGKPEVANAKAKGVEDEPEPETKTKKKKSTKKKTSTSKSKKTDKEEKSSKKKKKLKKKSKDS